MIDLTSKKVDYKVLLKRFGITFDYDKNISKLENFLSQRYDLRYNTVKNRIEFKFKYQKTFIPLDDRVYSSVFIESKRDKLKCTQAIFHALMNSDFIEEYDPFIEYFRCLKWDKETDYIGQLANTVKTTNDDFWKRAFKKWIVSVVACACMEKENHEVLVLCGKQGIGKTSWQNSLLPSKLNGYIFSGILNPSNKDTLFNITENIFINLDELENLNKSELGSLKSLITSSYIKQRRPYARFSETLIRRASFMGSINDREFLADTTGNRRYLCFTAEEIEYQHNINMDDVFAQAVHIFLNGENGEKFIYWFGKDDIKEIEKNNEEYRRISFEESLIEKYFILPTSKEGITYMTPTDIIYHINQYEGQPILDRTSLKSIGQALHRLGFHKKSISGTKPYIVKKRKHEQKPLVFSRVEDNT